MNTERFEKRKNGTKAKKRREGEGKQKYKERNGRKGGGRYVVVVVVSTKSPFGVNVNSKKINSAVSPPCMGYLKLKVSKPSLTSSQIRREGVDKVNQFEEEKGEEIM